MRMIMTYDLNFNQAELSELNKHGIELIPYQEGFEDEAEILVGYVQAPFKELDNIKGLQFVQSLKVGYDGIDLKRFEEKGVVFSNARGVTSGPIAEFVLMLILTYYKNYNHYKNLHEQKLWNRQQGTQTLAGQTAIVYGAGHIGQAVAKRLSAFDVELIGVNSDGRSIEGFDACVALSKADEFLKQADIVIGCLPLNEETRDLYNEDFFNKMKDDSIFINVGRGDQVDETALLKALDQHLGYAFLDVQKTEPLSETSPLYQHPKLMITPHVSAKGNDTLERQKELVLENVIRFKEGLSVKKRVI